MQDEVKTGLDYLIADLDAALINARSPKTGMQVPYHGLFANRLPPSSLRDLAEVLHRLRVLRGLL